jgi:signal transduction histidine kinase
MADQTPPLTTDSGEFRFDRNRVVSFMTTLERMASGEIDARLPISPCHDALDAIAHGINVLVGELNWAGARAREVQEEKAAELRAAVASAEARSGALVKAIPDLMFVFLRDGTYVDYHARDPQSLFAPPETFLGRNVRDVLPPAIAGAAIDAFERAYHSDNPIVMEYELPMREQRFFEARIVAVDAERLLTIVRDVTEAKRASELNRDLARRLIASQEIERQRLARELHDDVSQRLALLNLDIDRVAQKVDAEELRAQLHTLSAKVREISGDLHDMSYKLHPSGLRVVGFVAALQSLCNDTSQQRDLHVTFTHDAIPPSVDADVSLCLYRIVQEALHNVARHSHAREAQVRVTCDAGHIALRIADSGVGFDSRNAPQAGLGLISMRERAAAMQGQFVIDAVPGRGTTIAVRIPLGSQAASSTLPFQAST